MSDVDRTQDARSAEAGLDEVWRTLHGQLRKHVGPDLAEDCVQEAFLNALRRPPVERESRYKWLWVLTRNAAIRTGIREANRRERERAVSAQEGVWTSPTPDADAESRVLRLLEGLPQPYREVLQLRYVEGLEIDEIALRLGRPRGTVGSQIKRGLDRLRERVGHDAERKRGLRGVVRFLIRWRDAPSRARWTACASFGLVGAAALVFWWPARGEAVSQGSSPVPLVSALDTPVVRPLGPAVRTPVPTASIPNTSDLVAAETARSRIAGVVRSPAGDPIPGAGVHAAALDGQGREVLAVADERGRYEIEADPGGLIWATADGWCEGQHCYLPSASDRNQLDLFLSPTRGRATVLVRSAEGLPVGGARVIVQPRGEEIQVLSRRGLLEFPPPPSCATTSADGRAEVVFPERAWVEVMVYPDDRPAVLIEWSTPEAGTTKEFRLSEPRTLRGTCRDEENLPAANARVEVLQWGGLVCRETRTGDDGSYLVENLNRGFYVIHVFGDGVDAGLSARFGGVLEAQGERVVSRDLVLTESWTIRGRVLDNGRPVVGARASIRSVLDHVAEGYSPRTTATDADGTFVFAARLGEQIVNVQGPPEAPFVASGVTEIGAEPLLLEVDGSARPAPIELYFSGETEDAPRLIELQGPTGVPVILEPELGSMRFLSPSLPPGSYEVFAWSPARGSRRLPSIRHEAGSDVAHELRDPRWGSLSVLLDLPAGVVPEQVDVSVIGEGFLAHGIERSGRPSARRALSWDHHRGVFTSRLPPGQYPLVVRGAGLATVSETAHVTEGQETRVHLLTFLGAETRIQFVYAPILGAGEIVHVEAVTPFGSTRVDLGPWDYRLVSNGFMSTVGLPVATTELRIRTQSAVGGRTALEGRYSTMPGELHAPNPHLKVMLDSRGQ